MKSCVIGMTACVMKKTSGSTTNILLSTGNGRRRICTQKYVTWMYITFTVQIHYCSSSSSLLKITEDCNKNTDKIRTEEVQRHRFESSVISSTRPFLNSFHQWGHQLGHQWGHLLSERLWMRIAMWRPSTQLCTHQQSSWMQCSAWCLMWSVPWSRSLIG